MRTAALTLLAGLAGLVAAALVLLQTGVLDTRDAGGAATSTAPAPVAPAFPAPPAGAVVFSRRLGENALALGVVPEGERIALQASVVDGQGSGVRDLDVSFAVQGAAAPGTPCGPGCYRARVDVDGRPDSVLVEVAGTRPAARWRVALPADWPPADASGLLARADRVWRSLASLSFEETLRSGPGPPTVSAWRVQAPDRLLYRVRDGWSGMVIGDRRWDRPPDGGAWKESPQTPVHQPVPPWVDVSNAYVLGTKAVDGRPAWLVSFFDPRSRAWFSAALDRRSLRTLESRMVTTAHFMHDVYGAFNATPPIRPPE